LLLIGTWVIVATALGLAAATRLRAGGTQSAAWTDGAAGPEAATREALARVKWDKEAPVGGSGEYPVPPSTLKRERGRDD
jgi:hypothetical protein